MTATVVHTCGHCGTRWVSTADDVWRHRTLHGHTPTVATPTPIDPPHISRPCHTGRHQDCGGGMLTKHGPAACECWCGHDGLTAPRGDAA